MSRSFFAPSAGTRETRVDVPPSPGSISPTRDRSPSRSDSANAPFLNGSTQRDDVRMGAKSASAAQQDGGAAGMKALPPILSYCGASIMMTVVNKYVLSGAHFNMNFLVLLIQSLVGVIAVSAAHRLRVISLREFSAKDAKAWAPISTLLVLVIWTGSKALQYLNIPVYTIFKNLTIILIAYGEVLWFGGRVTPLTLCSFILMVFSSIIAAWSDISRAAAVQSLSFPHTPDSVNSIGGALTHDPSTGKAVAAYDALAAERARINAQIAAAGGSEVLDVAGSLNFLNSGYVWMAANCIVSAAYVLAMRKRIKVTGFKDWDTMFYNNLLSVPILVVMSLLVENWSKENLEVNFPSASRQSLVVAIVFSGACAVFISYTTAWCVRTTSSTTYSMVGALNKLPLALSGMVFFGDPVTTGSVSAISVGFLAGIVYAYAKNRQAEAAKIANMPATGSGSGQHANGKVVIPLHNVGPGAGKADARD